MASFYSVIKELYDKNKLYNLKERHELFNKKIWNSKLDEFDHFKANFYYPKNGEKINIYLDGEFVDCGDIILEINNSFYKIKETELIKNYLDENGNHINGEFILKKRIINDIN